MDNIQTEKKIINILKNRNGKPATADRLASECGRRNDNSFYTVLIRMDRAGKIRLSKSGSVTLLDARNAVQGIFRGNRRGFGFVTPEGMDEREGDIFIPSEKKGDAMDGDTVLIQTLPAHGEDRRAEGRVISVTKRARERVVGTLSERNVGTRRHTKTVFIITPDDSRLSCDIIAEGAAGGITAVAGDKVEARITRYPEGGRTARAVIELNMGRADSREANYAAILRENGIRCEFPEEVLAEAEEVSAAAPRPSKSRLDLRGTEILTIDGEDAKDLDDAISLEELPSGWRLGVHIADVSYYVRPGSALDGEAVERGTSVYFTDKVVPMLPTALSNGICSLNAGKPRYAMTALIELDRKGVIKGCELHESLIISKVRGVYSEVNDIFANGKASRFADKYEPVARSLSAMKKLFSVLEKRSKARGALVLETSEAKIILGADGLPCDIVKRERGDAERMIEQFMLCANEAVANTLYNAGVPCVYRIHEDPSPEKLTAFAEFAHNLGLPVGALRGGVSSPSAFSEVLSAASERGIAETVSSVALRSLAKARYSAKPSPHFGLGIEKYCHFTSPIRRYPDLSVHRITRAFIRGELNDKKKAALAAFAETSAQRSSENELRAISAERSIEDLYKCLYMSTRIGEVFDGVISSVTSFGFFVELADTCEGMVPITSLDGWYDFNERSLTLSRGTRVYALGTRVRVRVVRADIVTGKVDFVLE